MSLLDNKVLDVTGSPPYLLIGAENELHMSDTHSGTGSPRLYTKAYPNRTEVRLYTNDFRGKVLYRGKAIYYGLQK